MVPFLIPVPIDLIVFLLSYLIYSKVNGSRLSGSGQTTVSGIFTWSGGSLAGGTLVTNNATVITGNVNVTNSQNLLNYGYITLAGIISGDGGAIIKNTQTGIVELASNAAMKLSTSSSSSSWTFSSYGLVTKVNSTDNSYINVTFRLLLLLLLLYI